MILHACEIFSLRISSEEGIHEFLGIERQQISSLFSHAYIANGNAQFARNRDDDAALRGAVELGENDSGDAGGFRELPRLLQTILPGGGVHAPAGFRAARRE